MSQMAMKQSTFTSQRPAPLSRSRSVTVVAKASTKAAAKGSTFVCLDCGYVYPGSLQAFEKLNDKKYACPTCQAPKRRFKLLAPGETISGDDQILGIAGGTIVFIGLLYAALSYSGKI
eukprot:gene20121-26851_t